MKNRAKGKRILRTVFILSDSMLFSGMNVYAIIRLIGFSDHLLAGMILFPPILILVCTVRLIGMRRRESELDQLDEERKRTESLLLLSDEEIGQEIGEARFVLIRKLSPDWCDMLEAVRNGATAIGVLKTVQNGNNLLERYSPETRLYEKEAILQKLFPDSLSEKRSSSRFRKLLQKAAENKYLILGFFLLIASIWVHSKLYFRLLAETCFLIGAVTTYMSARKQIKILLIKEK